jgi:hypothetical protein
MAKHGRIRKVERRGRQRQHKIHNKGMAQAYYNLIKKQEEQWNKHQS